MVKITNILQPLIDAAVRDRPSLLKQLQVGQVLPAKILAQPQPGLLKLALGGTEVLARSQVTAEPGTTLRLEVTKGPPLPELRVLRAPTPLETQQQVARSAMARQIPPAEVRHTVTTLQAQARTPAQTDAVMRFVTLLRESGVRLDRLTPETLRHAVASSGIFHEPHLVSGRTPQTTDLKTQLLQMAGLLRAQLASSPEPAQPSPPLAGRPAPSPPTPREAAASGAQPRAPTDDSLISRLIRLVEGSASRVQLHQSVALPSDDGQRQAWQIELPIHLHDRSDDLKMRIERDPAAAENGGTPEWAVNLAFEFDTIGGVQCRVALSGERVAATFWCEREATHQRLESSLPKLHDALAGQGLDVVRLAGVLGAPAKPLLDIPLPDSLVDERA